MSVVLACILRIFSDMVKGLKTRISVKFHIFQVFRTRMPSVNIIQYLSNSFYSQCSLIVGQTSLSMTILFGFIQAQKIFSFLKKTPSFCKLSYIVGVGGKKTKLSVEKDRRSCGCKDEKSIVNVFLST